jgi:hypothetical protein
VGREEVKVGRRDVMAKSEAEVGREDVKIGKREVEMVRGKV